METVVLRWTGGSQTGLWPASWGLPTEGMLLVTDEGPAYVERVEFRIGVPAGQSQGQGQQGRKAVDPLMTIYVDLQGD